MSKSVDYVQKCLATRDSFSQVKFVQDFSSQEILEKQYYFDKAIDVIASTQELHEIYANDRNFVAFAIAASLFERDRKALYSNGF